MAPKNKSPLVDQPPSASTSEEHDPEEDEEEEEVESGQETEDDEPQQQQPNTAQSQSGSESDSGSGSDSDSDSGQSQPSPSASDFTVKPITQPKPAPKRAHPEAQRDKDPARKKPKIDPSSATPTIRLWSDEDQIAILRGLIDFREKKRVEPNSDLTGFLEFMKGKLQVDVSKSQLSEKIRRLKKKFLNNVANGPDLSSFKPNDRLMFELSNKFWGKPEGGTSNGGSEKVKSSVNGKAKKNLEVKKSPEPKKSAKVGTFTKPKDEKVVAVKEVVKEDVVKHKEDVVKGEDRQDFELKYPHMAAAVNSDEFNVICSSSAKMVKDNVRLIASDKLKAVEEKWKKMHIAEAELRMKRLDLIRENYKLVVDAMREN